MAKKKETKQEPIEKQLWKAADKLRKNIDAAEYKHIVLGLIFLKYISDSFEELYAKLKAGEGEYAGADPEDRDEYRAENVFFVPPSARWSYLQGRAKLPEIGKDIDNAMDAIERDNHSLKGVLPKVYAKENLDPTSLGQLIDLISNVALGDEVSKSQDVLGKVYEYFLGEFALAEGKKGGQFYTPESIVKLLVEMLQPYKGRVFDPCCGSGGMFVQSEKFILAHQGKINDISIYGQESNQTTWRLAKMNLAIRGIDSSQVKWNNEGSFLNDAHKDLKADYIIANPPFNANDWGGELLKKDARWQFGVPPESNANFAWIQHFVFHLSSKGKAGFILADSSLSSSNQNEFEIRKKMVQDDLVECIVSLPALLFSNTQIAVCIWMLNRNKAHKNKTLFIDASGLGSFRKRKNRFFEVNDISKIVNTLHSWQSNPEDTGINERGFSKSIKKEDIVKNNFVLSPNRYIKPIESDIDNVVDFAKKDFINTLNSLSEEIANDNEIISGSINNKIDINLNNVLNLMDNSHKAEVLSKNIFNGLINRYFIEEIFLNKEIKLEAKTFSELFSERSLKVKDIKYVPEVFSVTNNGIQPREGNFTKELSKSNQNYKVAFKGDMVFGLSREIPNLDVLMAESGAFSPAYTIYEPIDVRIGIIVGSIMRLKLMEQTNILKGGAREGRGLDKDKLSQKVFHIPTDESLDLLWYGTKNELS